MTVTLKKPPYIETVGAQYTCFNTPDADGNYTDNFESDVEKTEVVKSVTVTENVDTAVIRASGKDYDSRRGEETDTIAVGVIAFPAATLHRMRGDTVGEGGLIKSGGPVKRPFFAYGKVVHLSGGKMRLDWYPKCQLTENTDQANTSEQTFSEQTDTITITAYAFNDAGNTKVSVDSDVNWPDRLTEDNFFKQVILTDADLAAAIPAAGN